MAKKDHCGNRSQRASRLARVPDLGYYLIFTDTKGTEGNYINGLKSALPEKLRGRLVIKVIDDIRTQDLIQECKNKSALYPQYSKSWIMFDRDEVPNFDKIIQNAAKEGICTAWSNRCLEVWFEAYFQDMSYFETSEACWKHFAKVFKQKTGKDYKKSDVEIYNLLRRYGDEDAAIVRAKNKYNSLKNTKDNPSDMNPCSTVYLLVDEIQRVAKLNNY